MKANLIYVQESLPGGLVEKEMCYPPAGVDNDMHFTMAYKETKPFQLLCGDVKLDIEVAQDGKSISSADGKFLANIVGTQDYAIVKFLGYEKDSDYAGSLFGIWIPETFSESDQIEFVVAARSSRKGVEIDARNAQSSSYRGSNLAKVISMKMKPDTTIQIES